MKNKGLIIGGVLALVLLLGGGFFIMSRNNAPVEEEEDTLFEEELPELSKEALGLEFETNDAQNSVRFIINKPDGITALEYEITYTADGPEGDIDRGIFGTMDDVDTGGPVESKYHDLGSCSSGTCKFDKGVEKVDILLKIEKEGQTYQAKDSLTI